MSSKILFCLTNSPVKMMLLWLLMLLLWSSPEVSLYAHTHKLMSTWGRLPTNIYINKRHTVREPTFGLLLCWLQFVLGWRSLLICLLSCPFNMLTQEPLSQNWIPEDNPLISPSPRVYLVVCVSNPASRDRLQRMISWQILAFHQTPGPNLTWHLNIWPCQRFAKCAWHLLFVFILPRGERPDLTCCELWWADYPEILRALPCMKM